MRRSRCRPNRVHDVADIDSWQIRRCRVSTGTLAYIDNDVASSDLVVCLHGFPDQPYYHADLLGRLATARLHAVAPWLPGYAPSALKGPFTIQRVAQDVLEMHQRLAPSGRLSIVGHDWGAVVAHYLSARFAERVHRAVVQSVVHPAVFERAILRSAAQRRRSWYMMFFQLPWLSDRWVGRHDLRFIDRLWRDWSPGFEPDPAYMRHLKLCLSQSFPAPLQYYRQARSLVRERDVWRPTSVPTLYLHGEDDGCIGAELIHDQARFYADRFDVNVVTGAGHFLALERPEAVNCAVRDWLLSE